MIRKTRLFLVVSYILSVGVATAVCGAQSITINTPQDLQNMQNNLAGNYVLGGDIDASDTASWNGGTGFIPVGSSSTPFTGSFDGQGHTITGLTINSTLTYVGLFGAISGSSTVQNITLAQITVTSIGSGGNVGTLAGYIAPGSKVSHCSAQGTVQTSNGSYVGGLVGNSQGGSVAFGQAAVNVASTTNGGYIGGLVGLSNANSYFQTIYSYGNIQYSQASGSVSGMSSGGTLALIGGLVGSNVISTISNSRATGNVTGTGPSLVGGLAGQNSGWLIACIEDYCNNGNVLQAVGVTDSFATGSVSTGQGGSAGGLIGNDVDGYIYQDFATGNVSNSDGGGNEGGLIGTNEGGAIENAYATGSVTDSNAMVIGGLLGSNSYYYYANKWQITPIISFTYSVGAVQGLYAKHAGGLVGQDTTGLRATDSYWPTDSSLQTSSADGIGVTLAQLENGTMPTGFPATLWSTVSGQLPTLTACPPPASGYVHPKFQIMGVTYAPPGASSSTFVQYQNSTTVGTTQSVSQSFKDENSVSVSVSLSAGIEGFSAGSSIGVSYDTSQMTKTTSSVTTTMQVQQGEKTSGTDNYYSPVNHDYDLIWVWLNPLTLFTAYPSGSAGTATSASIEWSGYGFDADDQPDLDIIAIPLGYLNGDFGSMPPQYQLPLQRTWAASQAWPSGQGAALTAADFAQIAASDPFSNSNYGYQAIGTDPPLPETSDNRFTVSTCSGGQSFPYNQASPSAGAETYTCTLTNTNTSMKTKDITNTYSVTFTVDAKFGLSSVFGAELKEQNTLTWTTEYQSTLLNTNVSTASLSVQSPPCNNTVQGIGPCIPVYNATGNQPVQFTIYQDNMYGTFMFAPVAYYTGLPTPVATPTFGTMPGTYTGTQAISILDNTPGAVVYYTTDGSAPTILSNQYTGPVSISSSGTLQAIAVASGYTISNVASAVYTINPQVATPTFNPAAGTFASSQSVTISDTTNGAKIFYTTDGTAPTVNSSAYASPIIISNSEILKAIATATGYAQSLVASATYTNTAPVPAFQMSANPTALSVKAGQSGTATITVTPANGFNTAITLACSGLSAGMSCTFNPASITPNGVAITSIVTITTTAASTANLLRQNDPSILYCATFLPSSLLLLLLSRPRQRRSFMNMFIAIMMLGVSVLVISSCGSGGNNSVTIGTSTPTGTSAITVVGLASGSSTTNQSTLLAVTVTQ